MAENEPLLASEQSHNPQSASSLSARLRAGLAHPGKLNGLEKLLAGACVVLLLTSATGLGLFAGEAVRLKREISKHRHDHDGQPGGGGSPPSTITATATRITSTPSGTKTHAPGPTSTGGRSKNVSNAGLYV